MGLFRKNKHNHYSQEHSTSHSHNEKREGKEKLDDFINFIPGHILKFLLFRKQSCPHLKKGWIYMKKRLQIICILNTSDKVYNII